MTSDVMLYTHISNPTKLEGTYDFRFYLVLHFSNPTKLEEPMTSEAMFYRIAVVPSELTLPSLFLALSMAHPLTTCLTICRIKPSRSTPWQAVYHWLTHHTIRWKLLLYLRTDMPRLKKKSTASFVAAVLDLIATGKKWRRMREVSSGWSSSFSCLRPKPNSGLNMLMYER